MCWLPRQQYMMDPIGVPFDKPIIQRRKPLNGILTMHAPFASVWPKRGARVASSARRPASNSRFAHCAVNRACLSEPWFTRTIATYRGLRITQSSGTSEPARRASYDTLTNAAAKYALASLD
jgi:hypothetical protein